MLKVASTATLTTLQVNEFFGSEIDTTLSALFSSLFVSIELEQEVN